MGTPGLNDSSVTSSEISWPEPSPNWSEAKAIWKWGWKLHVFGFASMYIFVGLYTVFTEKHFCRKRKKLHTFFLNSMLVVFSSIRAIVLLWNPYASVGSYNKFVLLCIILHGVATSCATSAFSVLLLIVLETTKLSLAPPRFQKPGFLIGIWTSNIIYFLTSHLIVARFNSAKAMIFVCQVLFAIWGLVISVGYAVAAYKIRKNLCSSRKNSHYNDKLSKDYVKLHKLVTLLCVASVGGFSLFIVSIYMASSETGVFNDSGHVAIWPWFGLQTSLRFLELLMCAIIFLIALNSGSGDAKDSRNSVPLQTSRGSVRSKTIN